MSNLKEYLLKRRSKFYSGQDLQNSIAQFLHMLNYGADIFEFPDAVIVLEHSREPHERRGWLLFDKFNRNVVRAMQKVSEEFEGTLLYAETHDIRIRNLLLKMGYMELYQTATDYYLVKRGKHNGM